MANTRVTPADTATQLSMERTWLSHERTMMSWVRTATSLISFGFTIYKFFEFEAQRSAATARPLISPRHFAMIMIGTGLIALLMSTIEHRRSVKRLEAESGIVRRSVAGSIAALIALMGLLAFLAALLRQ